MTLDAIIKDIADTIRDSVNEAVKSVSEKYDSRIKELDSKISELSSNSVKFDELKSVVDDAVSSIIIEKPKDGVDGKDGKDGKDGLDGADGKDGSDGRDGANGKDGVDGKDGVSPSPDDVAKAMEHHFAKWALDFERNANSVLEKAIDRMPKPRDGVDGKNAIEIKDFDISIGEDKRTLTVKLGDVSKSVRISSVIHKGVYSPSYEYQDGDCVTFGGSLWIAKKDFPQGAPNNSDDWQLSVKKGRDGKEVVKIEKPKTVKVGE